jgi:hypothetical protein
MRIAILSSAILVAAVFEGHAAPPTINGAWVLSEKWHGYMGIALVIKDNEFKYWFYSDAKLPDEPKYPITGKVEFDGDIIRLVPNGNEHLYDTKWRLVTGTVRHMC